MAAPPRDGRGRRLLRAHRCFYNPNPNPTTLTLTLTPTPTLTLPLPLPLPLPLSLAPEQVLGRTLYRSMTAITLLLTFVVTPSAMQPEP